MSLILEALRKSEAERHRGRAPSLYAELPPSPRAQQTRIPSWAWLLLAGVVLLVVLWLARDPGSQAPAQETASDTPADVVTPAGSNATAAALPSVPRLLSPPAASLRSAPAASPPVESPAPAEAPEPTA
ncbi:MAG: hypothetical protein ABIO58_00145, partial [Luteimonas sp.]